MIDKEHFKKLTEQKFKISEVEFSIKKMNAHEGHEVFEVLRVALFDRMAKIQSKSFLEDMYNVLFGLPVDLLKDLKKKFFTHIKFKTKHEKFPLYLTEANYNTAFETLEPLHVYELLIRSLAVNFFSSFSIAMKKYQEIERLSKREQQQP